MELTAQCNEYGRIWFREINVKEVDKTRTFQTWVSAMTIVKYGDRVFGDRKDYFSLDLKCT